jgi:hypothetical protein
MNLLISPDKFKFTFSSTEIAYLIEQILSAKFKFFWLGVLILLPTAFIFLLKININKWFDKNDFSHVLFIIGITYFYLGISGVAKGLKQSAV